MTTTDVKIAIKKSKRSIAATNTFDEIMNRPHSAKPLKGPYLGLTDEAKGRGKRSPIRVGTDSFGERVYTTLTPLVVDLFLEGVCRTNNVTLVCSELNISRIVIYAMKNTDPAFRQRLADAQTIGIDAWEDFAALRAFEGIERKVFHQGIQIDTIKEYSDSIAIAMLKGAKPEKYATRNNNEVIVGGSLGINLENLTDTELNDKINTKLIVLGSIKRANALAV